MMEVQRTNVYSVGKIEVKAIFVGNCWVEWQSILHYVALEKCDASVRSLGHLLAHRWYYSHLTEWRHSPAEEMGICASCDHLQEIKSYEGHPLIANK